MWPNWFYTYPAWGGNSLGFLAMHFKIFIFLIYWKSSFKKGGGRAHQAVSTTILPASAIPWQLLGDYK